MASRWSKDDPKQGSAFHELIVLPTVAPHLARPYHLPGTPEYLAAQAELAHQSELATPVDATDSGSAPSQSEHQGPNDDNPGPDDEPEDLVRGHEFYVLKMSEAKNTPGVVKILTMTRAQFVTAALSAHGYQHAYIPGPTSGPGMHVSWAGVPGGKKSAPIVHDEADWNMIKVQLHDQVRRTRGRLNSVCVTFDLDTMEGFKNRKRPLSPTGFRDVDHVELLAGTHVPSVESFSPEQAALGRAIEEIKASWSCEKHGVCFITKEASHVELNRFRLGAFAAAVIAGQCVASGPPPPELLQAWAGPQGTISASAAKVPRGWSGPVCSSSEGVIPSVTPDPATLLLTTVVPMMTMMAQQTMSSMHVKKRYRRQPSPPSSLPPSSPPPSSSPPAIEDELGFCLEAFGRSRGLSEEKIEKAIFALQAENYSPDSISETTLSASRLQELTGFLEGEVFSLRQFTRKWCGKVDTKRAKLGHY